MTRDLREKVTKLVAPVLIALNALAGHVLSDDGLIRMNTRLTAQVIRQRKLGKNAQKTGLTLAGDGLRIKL